MRSLTSKVSLLLLGSGFCALVYQTVWLRELRLVFGASTAASAAVLAIFMAGLGAGGLILGRRTDRSSNPLGLYAHLELGVAIAAGLSPLLLMLLRAVYVGLGGTAALGSLGGTLLRLGLAAVVLGIPTFLMGGTLPAAVRAVEGRADAGRRRLGSLYGANTLGAVAGVVLTTFWAIEILGLRQTILVAALLNLLMALLARSMARGLEPATAPTPTIVAEADDRVDTGRPRPIGFILPAAGAVGFAFLLMELVWYRMLAPLLGGSSYTFGLILAVALAGIGAGGLLYARGAENRRPTLTSFAGTCTLEALAVIIPFALGDRIAVLALFLRSLGATGFDGLVFAWTLVTVIVVLPAALVAGYQFPLLVAVLGRGREHVGREVGLTYAWNTAGAILGSLAGGFGLLPLLSAPGAWRLVALLLLGCAAVALVLDRRRVGVPIVALGVLGLVLAFAPGPGAAWRHVPIGAGRIPAFFTGPNDLERYLADRRRHIAWEADGVESSVALHDGNGYAFLINGKTDGNSRTDAPTQVMLGLVGAALHPAPTEALVIGLGTGSTAGWLARVPGIERVEVVEIEPAIEDIARVCGPVNQDAMTNPKVVVRRGDGRELLLTTPQRYDLIASEPSNPYRAGIASLFSHEFYSAAAERLRPGGLFSQWLQGYEVDAELVRTVYATLGSVFPYVESWQIQDKDLLLVASMTPIDHDLERIRARIEQAPFRSALAWVWGIRGVEGFYSGFVASPDFAAGFRDGDGLWVNTDDRPVLEFGFARNLGRPGLFAISQLRALARQRQQHRPEGLTGELDWQRVRELETARSLAFEVGIERPTLEAVRRDHGADGAPLWRRVEARAAYEPFRPRQVVEQWFAQPEAPQMPIDLLIVAESLAQIGDPRAPRYAERLRATHPAASEAILARWHRVKGRDAEAVEHLLAAFRRYRTDPWPHGSLMKRALDDAGPLARRDPALGRRLYDVLAAPFAVHVFQDSRLRLRFDLAKRIAFDELCVEALEPLEPHVPWEEGFLRDRLRCYQATGHARAGRARSELETFLDAAAPRLVVPSPGPETATGAKS